MTEPGAARREYEALEWVPDGEMGFDPGGREVKRLADAAIAEADQTIAELKEKYAVVGQLSGDLAHSNTLLIGRCESLEDALSRYRERNGRLVEQAGDWQLRAEEGADALSQMTARHDGEQKAKAKAERNLEAYTKRAHYAEGKLSDHSPEGHNVTNGQYVDAVVRAEQAEAEVARLLRIMREGGCADCDDLAAEVERLKARSCESCVYYSTTDDFAPDVKLCLACFPLTSCSRWAERGGEK